MRVCVCVCVFVCLCVCVCVCDGGSGSRACKIIMGNISEYLATIMLEVGKEKEKKKEIWSEGK